jgi:flagellar biosynthetic protein FlhB
VLFVLAGLDYAYQRWYYMDNLKMTRQEIKDELKQSEGDPMVKSRIRQIQREMARRRMFEAIPGRMW